MKTYKTYIIAVLLAIVGVFGYWFFNSYGEFEKPKIALDTDFTAIGQRTVLNVQFTDAKSGLAHASVSVTQDGTTHLVASAKFTGGVAKKTIPVTIDPIALKLHDGPAVVTITATDQALWKNSATLSKNISVDVIPAQIFLLTPTNHINPGGTCMILYRISKPVRSTQVFVDNEVFAAYPVTVSGKPCYISYFTLPIEIPAGGGNIRIQAKDLGGNESFSSVPKLLLLKKFRSDKMPLTDRFLQMKMPEFLPFNPALKNSPLIDIFTWVNTALRADNFKTIQGMCQKSEGRQLWQDAFLRMKNASPMAQFGDKRTYIYNGKDVGQSVHMGQDLASTANAPIEAANNGIVTFAGPLGIYGNTVMIDHGLGISTLYSHMASVQVKAGQPVKKGDTLGKSGLSGLAGGDHLHFSVLVGGRFVNPTEWWDPHWIADNVTKKMNVAF